MSHRQNEDEWSPQGPVTELSDAESWKLLGGVSFGHLGVSSDNQPDIFPVYFSSVRESIVFRTAAGSKLHDLLLNPQVVLEADAQTDSGTWSVVISGSAAVVTGDEAIEEADRAVLPPWIPTQPFVYVRITPSHVRGRYFLRRLPVDRH